jgi:hypothetical protein
VYSCVFKLGLQFPAHPVIFIVASQDQNQTLKHSVKRVLFKKFEILN